MDLQNFNVFGSINLERNHIHIIATGVLPGNRSIEKVLSEDLEQPIEAIQLDMSLVILFAAYVNADGKSRIATQNLSARAGGPDVSGNEEVKMALKKITSQFR